jgi:hypothetical protein
MIDQMYQNVLLNPCGIFFFTGKFNWEKARGFVMPVKPILRT